MGKDYPGIQRLKNDGSNWHQYWTQLYAYLRGEGLLHVIQEDAGPPLHPKLQEEKPTISIDRVPEDADKEERDEILERSQIIADTNDSIRSTNKVLNDEYNKELKQYNKDDGKVCSVILGTIDKEILTALEHKQTAKDYIEHLKQSFEARGLIHEANVWETFVKLRFQSDQAITTFSSRYQEAVQGVKQVKLALDDKIIIYQFINAVDEHFPMWAQIQRDKIRDGRSISLLQLIADLTDEARRKESPSTYIYTHLSN